MLRPVVRVSRTLAAWLEMDGVRINGRLVDPSMAADASSLVWAPDLGKNASPLARGVSGRIVYRDPLLAGQTPLRSAPLRAEPAGGLLDQLVTTILEGSMPGQPPSLGRRSLHLRSGDTIPCEVSGMNEK